MTNSIYDSEIHYPKGTPFTYLIGWTELKKFYYGVRFAKDCHPSDLWSKYFTSSKAVEKFRLENSEPDLIRIDFVFDTAKEAREYEYQFLKENNCIHDPKWLNLGNGGKDFCYTEHTEETRQKISDRNKGKTRSEEHRQRISDCQRGRKHSAESIKKTADALRGKPRSAETRQRISDGKKGKPSPKKGIPMSDEQKKHLSDLNKGKKLKAESIQKRTETRKQNRLAKLQTLENCF